MAGPVNLSGARQRLLAEHIPLRFFGLAATVHIGAWVGLAVVADNVPYFSGGAGPELAAIHLLTVGVLLATAMGASLQMLPVIVSRDAPSDAACGILFWLLLAGGTALVIGMAVYEATVFLLGAVGLAVAIAVYVVTLLRVIWRAVQPRVVVLHVWAALVALVAAATLAVVLAGDGGGLIHDRGAAAAAHLVLAAYGFMGLLALGFGYVLIPMFAVAMPRHGTGPAWSLGTAGGGVAVGAAALLVGSQAGVLAALALGLVGVGLHLRWMLGVLRHRMRRRLGPEFLLIGASWVLLPVGLVVAAAGALGAIGDRGGALFGFLLLYGWLLTLVMGVLQRIVPFLASMHVALVTGRPAAPSELGSERLLRIHGWAHLGALSIVAVGIAADLPLIVRGGAAVGAVAAAVFGAFVFGVVWRTRKRLKDSEEKGVPGQ